MTTVKGIITVFNAEKIRLMVILFIAFRVKWLTEKELKNIITKTAPKYLPKKNYTVKKTKKEIKKEDSA